MILFSVYLLNRKCFARFKAEVRKCVDSWIPGQLAKTPTHRFGAGPGNLFLAKRQSIWNVETTFRNPRIDDAPMSEAMFLLQGTYSSQPIE